MPCYQTGSAEGDARLSLHEEAQKVEILTNMLCGLCTKLEKYYATSIINEDPVLSQWWKEHQKKDAEYKALILASEKRAKLAHDAIAKLTEAEIEALGIR